MGYLCLASVIRRGGLLLSVYQMKTDPSAEPAASWRPSGFQAARIQMASEADSECNTLPVDESHILTVLSPLAVARRSPSGFQDTSLTQLVCSENESSCFPVAESQTFAVMSAPEVASRLPSGLHATLQTLSRCPVRAIGSFHSVSQIFAVPSLLAVARCLPSAFQETSLTQS